MVRHSTTSERYEHKWKTHVAGGYKCLGSNFEQHVFPGPMAMPKPLRLQHLRWEGDEVTEIWTRDFENKGQQIQGLKIQPKVEIKKMPVEPEGKKAMKAMKAMKETNAMKAKKTMKAKTAKK